MALVLAACASAMALAAPTDRDRGNVRAVGLVAPIDQEPVDEPALFYRPTRVGSGRVYNPLSSFFQLTLDALQLDSNFDTDNYSGDLEAVIDRLLHPRRVIEEEGGFRRFVNREIFPIDSEYYRDSFAMLPNYGLHLLGDGMAYRRDAEWYRARGVAYPRISAAATAMVSEVLQEALETEETTEADAIADVYLFRPLGILLYSHDGFARFISRHLNPSIWPTLLAWDFASDRFINAGVAYVYRPPAWVLGNARGFVYTGFTNLAGLSHPLRNGDTLSWGLGVSVAEIERQRNIQADIQPSAGLFRDRRGSLLWSIVLNDAGGARLRTNLYPYGTQWNGRAGLFLSVNDSGEIAAGLSWHLPLAAGVSR